MSVDFYQTAIFIVTPVRISNPDLKLHQEMLFVFAVYNIYI
jgi:hypothetical protein